MKIAVYNPGGVETAQSVLASLTHAGFAFTDLDELGFEDIGEVAQELTLEGAEYAALLLFLGGAEPDAYLLRALSHGGVQVPIVALTKGGQTRRIHALDAGACHAITLPLAGDELAAIIRAAVRVNTANRAAVVEAGDLVVNMSRRIAYRRSTQQQLALTGKEYALLEALALSKGRTMTKEAILSAIYTAGIDDEPELKIIDVFVCKLRKKISQAFENEDAGGDFIRTVWGRGYMLADPDEPLRATA